MSTSVTHPLHALRAVSAREIEGIRCMFDTAIKHLEGVQEKGVPRELLQLMLARFLGPSKRIAKNVSSVAPPAPLDGA